MPKVTRRDLLKAGLAATAGAVSAGVLPAAGAERLPAQAAAPAVTASAGRERLLLDASWRFQLGDADDFAKDLNFGRGQSTFAKATGVGRFAAPNFNDSAWRQLDLPHDWAIELPFQNDPGLPDHGGKPLGRNYPTTSIGWYRRAFDLPAADEGRRLAVEFDGVFRNAMVFFNNHYVGDNFSGYAPFRLDLTELAVYGGRNALTLRVDATLGEGWFYEGAGIYRHVWLVKTDPVHIAPDGVFLRSQVQPGAAEVAISTEVVNDSDAERTCRATHVIRDAAGREVATFSSAPVRVAARRQATLEARAQLRTPALWSIETPHLYTAATTLAADGAAVDARQDTFGVRTIAFDPQRGFLLNGQSVKIKGTCNHQDHAGVGAALPDRLQVYRIERLKAMGSNGLRTSHNPPAPELMDACDRLGMVVMAETRMMGSTAEGLSQLERLIRTHRNHPCIVLWSMGNEEPQQSTPTGARVVASMKRLVRRLDGTRPVTAAMNGGWVRGGVSDIVDVQGCNYNESRIDAFHAERPQQPMIGSETASAIATRGIYAVDKEHGYVSAYDTNVPGSYAKTAEDWWKFYVARPFLAGGFAWTGFDYRGEPSPYQWPCISSHFGIMDSCGFPKDTYYYYQAWWTGKPVLHLFPHWNWTGKEGQPIAVWVHTNLDSVELFVNGTSLGAKKVERNGHVEWQVPFEAGWIEARGSQSGRLVLSEKRETVGAAARLALRADRGAIDANGEDLAVLTVEVQDAQGRAMPTATNLVRFGLEGPGRILGVGNGDPSCHEPDNGAQRSAFNGLCMALVQAGTAPGELLLTASADGLAPATVSVAARAAAARPAVPVAGPPPPTPGRGG